MHYLVINRRNRSNLEKYILSTVNIYYFNHGFLHIVIRSAALFKKEILLLVLVNVSLQRNVL